jgi:hypothetical protein
MPQTLPFLDQIRLASPCPASWEQMCGDERTRHCDLCQLKVYNLSALSRADAEAFISAKEGQQVCVRLYRRVDGTVLTQDCPIGLRALRQRVTRRAGATIALALSLFGVTRGRSAENYEARVKVSCAEVGGKWEQTAPAFSYVKGNVTNKSGAAIAGATITLINEDTLQETEVKSEKNGAFLLQVFTFTGYVYSIKITAPGFVAYKHDLIELYAGKDVMLTIKLEKAKAKKKQA